MRRRQKGSAALKRLSEEPQKKNEIGAYMP